MAASKVTSFLNILGGESVCLRNFCGSAALQNFYVFAIKRLQLIVLKQFCKFFPSVIN